MAKKKVLFWLGEGVININGKDYGAEMPLPVDELDPEALEKMLKDGRVGEKIAPVAAFCEGCAGQEKTINGLNILIVELESEVERLTGELEEATKPAKTEKKDGKK